MHHCKCVAVCKANNLLKDEFAAAPLASCSPREFRSFVTFLSHGSMTTQGVASSGCSEWYLVCTCLSIDMSHMPKDRKMPLGFDSDVTYINQHF